MVDKNFDSILEISAKCGYLTNLLKTTYRNADITATDMSPLLLDSFEHNHKLLIDDEDLEFPPNSFDLIAYSLGLHWINDVQRFLSNIRTFLKPDGIFIGNFVGGNSLKKLRKSLIDTEIASNFKHSPHISPFIHFDHVPILLSQAGFAEVIVDYENISLKFDNPLVLMREIKNIGESNSLNLRHNYAVSKKMFFLLQNYIVDSAPFGDRHEERILYTNKRDDEQRSTKWESIDYTNGFEDNITLISFIASPNKNNIRLKLL